MGESEKFEANLRVFLSFQAFRQRILKQTNSQIKPHKFALNLDKFTHRRDD